MKAMILAAGLGQRMRPLTDHLPKPLLKAGEKTLLDYHLEKIQTAGITQVIINLAYLGHKIREQLNNRYPNLSIAFSEEPEPLETGGAILHAARLLGDSPFLLVNGDVWSDMDYAEFINRPLSNQLGHLMMVPNPEFHPQGDFAIQNQHLIEKSSSDTGEPSYTFAGISLLSPDLITHYPLKRQKFPLVEVFRAAIQQKKITAEIYYGHWSDVGTPERLINLDNFLSKPHSKHI
jgi:N-acetyl-alpha-D-muramate 1-phosphate uridylyltransferase